MSRFSTFVDDVHTRLNDATVQKVIGDKERGRNRQRRRLHWYRTGGEIVPSRTAGGTVESAGDDITGTRTPSVKTRMEDILCRVFAESEDTLDTLLDNVIVAINQTAREPAVEWGEYTWEATQKDEFAKRIPMVELQFALRLPVADEQRSLTQITAELLTCEIDEDL